MDWASQLDGRIAEELPSLDIRGQEPMSRHTSFRIGGPARRMAFPKSGEELARLLELAEACGARPLVIGNGTNLLAPDEGLDRLVVNTSEGLCRVERGGLDGVPEGLIRAEAGCSLRRAAEFACAEGLRGMEFAHGIPGSVGGAVCMNAGAYGGEMSQILEGVSVWLPGEGVRYLTREELRLGYRHSLFTERPDAAAVFAVLRLEPGEQSEIRARTRELMARRKQTQPLEYPSAGSTFKRPEGYYAGTLIDQCGLKGLQIGGAQVSEKHAGFIINRGGASSADVAALIAEVQRRVLEQTGVTLEPEVRMVR